jgi:hypothetical protein
MKSIKYLEGNNRKRHAGFTACSLVIAAVLGSYGVTAFTAAHAQDTAGRIFGSAPAGESIVVHGSTGSHRHVTANSSGRYSFNTLSPGDYTVTLENDGKAVDTRSKISLLAGMGAEVDFACPNDKCAAGG